MFKYLKLKIKLLFFTLGKENKNLENSFDMSPFDMNFQDYEDESKFFNFLQILTIELNSYHVKMAIYSTGKMKRKRKKKNLNLNLIFK